MEKKKNIQFLILLGISFVVLSIILVDKTFQNDTFYTIKIGEDILKYGVDFQDHYSWIPHLSYVYPHWLYDVLIFLIYQSFGFFGVYVSTIVLVFLLLLLMYFTTRDLIKDSGISYLVVVFISFTLRGFMTARAQLVSYLLLLFIVYCLEKIRLTNKKKYVVGILLSAVLIANIHSAVWPMVLVLFLPHFAEDMIIFWKSKRKKEGILGDSKFEEEKVKNGKTIGKIFLLTLLTGLVTANGFTPYTYMIKIKMGVTMSYISEHLPTTFPNRPALFVLMFFLLLLWLQKKVQMKTRDFFLVFGLFLLALLSRRSYALFAILSIYAFARVVQSFLRDRVSFSMEKAVCHPLLFVVLISLFLSSLIGMIHFESKKSFVDSSQYPVEASNFILENLSLEQIHLYNEYNFGSYLLYRGIPVFIDSRSDLYTEEFNPGCEVFQDAIQLFSSYQEVFEKYQVTHVLLSHTNKLNQVLQLDKRYQILYQDDNFLLYEREIPKKEVV